MQMAFAMLLFVTSTMAAFGQAVSEQPFTVSISTEKSTFKSGDPIPVKVELTNTSNKDLNVSSGVDLNSGVLFTHSFEVHNETGKLVPPRIHTHQQSQTGSAPAKPEENPTGPETGRVIFGVLKPGEKYSVVDDISRVYDLSESGRYTIQMAHPLPDKSSKDGVKSNVVTITVTQ